MTADIDPRQLARSADPATSKAAAARPGKVKPRTLLLQAFARAGSPGLTSAEAATDAGVSYDIGWRRCSDLLKLGYIEVTGQTRPLPSGSAGRVYRITRDGRTELGEQLPPIPIPYGSTAEPLSLFGDQP